MKSKMLAVFVVAAMLAAGFVSAINMQIEKKEIRITGVASGNSLSVAVHKIKPMNLAMEGKEIKNAFHPVARTTDIPVGNQETTEMHPTVATDGKVYFAGYTNSEDILTQDIYMAYSPDGTNWQPTGYWNIDGVEDYPSFDYWGNGKYYGTFQPDPSTSYQYLMNASDITDPSTYSLVYWDWSSYGWYDFKEPAIACDGSQNPWEYGFIATIASTTYTGYECTNAPHMFFADPEASNRGYISWYNTYNNTMHCDVDIDTSTHMGYAVYDWLNESSSKWTILVWERSFEDPLNGDSTVIELNSQHNDQVPSVGAANGYVYIACQEDYNIPGKNDIVCYYSHDGGVTWEESVIAGDPAKDEMYPKIIAYGDSAACIYLMDGDVYYSFTTDGGATWSEPEKVNDNAGSVVMEYRSAMLAKGGAVMWTDNQAGNYDVYYDNVGVPSALITIEGIKGGFGVSATIKNIGGAAGKSIPWSIKFDGLVFLNKEKSGTVDIAPGEEKTISTGFALGIGPVTVTVTAGSDTATAKGFMLGPLVLGLK